MVDVNTVGVIPEGVRTRAASPSDQTSRPDANDRPAPSNADPRSIEGSRQAEAGLSADNLPEDPVARAEKVINDVVSELLGRKLRINRDEDSDRFVYQSIDRDTGDVLRQFPPEEILEILGKFRAPEGIVLDDEV